MTIPEASSQPARATKPEELRQTFEALAELLSRHRGDRRVFLELLGVKGAQGALRVKVDVSQRVRPSETLKAEVERICGAGSVELR